MIQLFHVTKVYPGDPPALDDLTLQVEKGELVFITGPSGAGKTTLLKLVFCAERPTSGQILVEGRNVARLRAGAIPFLRRNVGVVFQDFKLLQNRSALDNVAFALEVLGLPAGEVRRRSREALARVGLIHKAQSLPQRMSGGEQQRVAIARALVNAPTILLADEPTGNLDDQLAAEIFDLLVGANAAGTTVLIATHDKGLIARHPRRVVQLHKGRLAADRS